MPRRGRRRCAVYAGARGAHASGATATAAAERLLWVNGTGAAAEVR